MSENLTSPEVGLGVSKGPGEAYIAATEAFMPILSSSPFSQLE
jgi:hypothetical protein